jgi:hypothetical protein
MFQIKMEYLRFGITDSPNLIDAPNVPFQFGTWSGLEHMIRNATMSQINIDVFEIKSSLEY